jgi:hypothetical protein
MAGEPAYVTSLEEVAWGLVLIAMTIVMHGFGTTLAILTTRGLLDPTRPERLFRSLAHIIVLAQSRTRNDLNDVRALRAVL